MRKIKTITVAMITMSVLLTGCANAIGEMPEGNTKVETVSEVTSEATNATIAEPAYETVVETEVVEGEDVLGLLPQTITKAVEYRVNTEDGSKEIISESCKSWKVKHKNLGGTAWKKTTPDGELYLRLRDTIEFFSTTIDPEVKSTSEVEFATTILSALYTDKDGEISLERIHVMSGIITADGKMTLKGVKVQDNTEVEFVLDEFEQIDKSELPFTEEEFRAVADQN